MLKTARRRSMALRAGVLLVCSMVLLALVDHLGVTRAVDRALESTYFTLRGERSSSSKVVLVALDENTVAAWGAPPWSWARMEELVAQMQRGAPARIALLEHGPRVLPEVAALEGPLAEAQKSGLLFLPGPEQAGVLAVRVGTGPVESVQIEDERGRASVLARLAIQAELPLPAHDTLPVNYLGPASTLPTVAAHRVVSGEIPPSTFTDRFVVIGLQGERFTPLLPTPVGPMSPAEVQAHALAGLVDGAVWTEVPAWLRWAILALICAAGLLLVPRLPNRAVLASGLALIAIVLVADYWLFAAGVARPGAAAYLLAGALATTAAGITERGQARRELLALSRWLREQGKSDARDLRAGEDAFLLSFLRSSRAFVDYESTIFAELPQGEHHLVLRHYVDTGEDQVFERRRDVRREPYLKAYQSHRPEWATRLFMNKDLELKTLMVPLVELGRILGYWIINFPRDARITRQELKLIEILGHQASIALDRRRLYLPAGPPQRKLASLRSPSVLLSELSESRHTAASLMQNQRRVDELFERLPVGVLVATLWGEIEQINGSMRGLLKESGIEDPLQMGLSGLIARLAGEDEDEVRAQLRRVIDAPAPLRIGEGKSGRSPAPPPGALIASHELILTRVSGGGLGEIDADGASVAAHFVLTASERSGRSATRGAWLQDVSAPPDDVARVVDIMPKIGSGRH